MPRAAKTIRRQIINAGIEYKKGNRKEAYELWKKATAARKLRYTEKNFKRKRAEEAAAAEAAAAKAAAEEAAKKAAEEAAAKKAEEEAAKAESTEESAG